jgi:hypothetical protein
VIRPVFVLAISKLYTDVIPVNVELEGTVTAGSDTEIDWPTLVFAMLTGITSPFTSRAESQVSVGSFTFASISNPSYVSTIVSIAMSLPDASMTGSAVYSDTHAR